MEVSFVRQPSQVLARLLHRPDAGVRAFSRKHDPITPWYTEASAIGPATKAAAQAIADTMLMADSPRDIHDEDCDKPVRVPGARAGTTCRSANRDLGDLMGVQRPNNGRRSSPVWPCRLAHRSSPSTTSSPRGTRS